MANYDNLIFPVFEVQQNKDLLQEFPKLAKYPEFRDYTFKDRNKWIKYIVLVYDINSPYTERQEDWREKKEMAATEAGLLNTKGNFPEKVKKVLDGDFRNDEDLDAKDQTEPILDMIICFLTKIVARPEWTELCTLLEEYEEYMRRRQKAVVGKTDDAEMKAIEKKDQLRRSCQEIVNHIRDFEEKVFGEHDDVKREAYKTQVLTPEKIAKK